MIRLRFTQGPVSGGVFSCEIVSSSESMVILRVSGAGSWDLFRHESGGHRWQRVPPTETKGRRHSSTFTVAVFRDKLDVDEINLDDIEFTAQVGHGPGGQHRNKTATAIRAVHVPTGETVFIQNERSQRSNLESATEEVVRRVQSKSAKRRKEKENASRKLQIGSGERSDKIRTVQEQNDRVIDHRTGNKCSVASYLKGEIWRLQK